MECAQTTNAAQRRMCGSLGLAENEYRGGRSYTRWRERPTVTVHTSCAYCGTEDAPREDNDPNCLSRGRSPKGGQFVPMNPGAKWEEHEVPGRGPARNLCRNGGCASCT